MDYKDPHLVELSSEYDPFEILNHLEDSQFPGVYLLHLRFPDDQGYGLCIYDSKNNTFIEEPGDYYDYGVTPEEVESKYNFTH